MTTHAKHRITENRLRLSDLFGLLILLFIGLCGIEAHAGRMRGHPGNNAYPKVIDKTLKAAAKCVPKVSSKGIKFCTGFTITNKEIDALVKGGDKTCRAKINGAHYSITSLNEDQKVPEADWKNFLASTRSAMTYADLKVVALKPKSDFVDCVHEYVHVLQHTIARDKLLAPRVRDREFRAVEQSVTEQADKVESLEKAGLKAHAIIQAGKAQQAIDKLKEYGDLSDTLDEVEAHFFILRYCDKLKCTDDDRETAVANLYQRKDSLDPKLKSEIESLAHGLIDQKKKVAIAEAKSSYKQIPVDELDRLLDENLKKDWDSLLRDLKKSGLRLVRIDNAAPSILDTGAKIPLESLRKLEGPNEGDLSLAADSKLLSGTALSKFICKVDKEYPPSIFLTVNTTRAALVHALAQSRESSYNADYCSVVFGQRIIDDSFNRGELDRRTHDQKLLYSQALNSLAELQIYKAMLKYRDIIGKPEALNDELLISSYEDWLGEAGDRK